MLSGIVFAQELSVEAGNEIVNEQDKIKNEINELLKRRKQLDEQENELAKTLKEQAERLTKQRDSMDEQSRLLRQQKKSLQAQKKKIDGLRLQLDDLATPLIVPDESDSELAPSKVDASTNKSDVPDTVGQAPPIKSARPLQVADVIDNQVVLTRKGSVIVEPSIQFSYSSVTRVALEGFTIIPAITIGSIDVKEVDRSTTTTSLTMRYGITNRFEAGIRVPYVDRKDTTVTRPLAVAAEADTITSAEGRDIGDVELSFNYMFDNGGRGQPFYVGSLRLKSRTGTDPFETPVDPVTGLQTALPTGTGFLSVQPGVSFSFPSDPAVFYGSLSYLKNIGRVIDSATGRIDPGNAFGLSFGMAIAVNPRASFSLGYSHNTVSSTKQNGVELAGSDQLQVGSLIIGLSHKIGRRRSLNVSVGTGLTEDAPDVQISFRMPISYQLFD